MNRRDDERVALDEGPEHSYLVAFVTMNPAAVTTGQLPVQRKALNLKNSHCAHPDKIWSVVEDWTTQ